MQMSVQHIHEILETVTHEIAEVGDYRILFGSHDAE